MTENNIKELVEGYLSNIENIEDIKNENSILEIVKYNPEKLTMVKNKLSIKSFKHLIDYYLQNNLMTKKIHKILLSSDILKNQDEILELAEKKDYMYLYFLNIDTDMQLRLSQKDVSSLAFVNSPNLILLEMLMERYSYLINTILNPKYELTSYISTYNYFYKFFTPIELSRDLIMKSVYRGNFKALKFVDSLTDKEERSLMKNHGTKFIQYMNKPSKNIVKTAFNQNHDMFQYVSDKVNYQFKKYAVKRAGYVIQWIENPTKKLMELSLYQNPKNIKHIMRFLNNNEKLREDILKTAVSLDVKNISQIPKNFHTVGIAEIVLKKNKKLIKEIDIMVLNQMISNKEN